MSLVVFLILNVLLNLLQVSVCVGNELPQLVSLVTRLPPQLGDFLVDLRNPRVLQYMLQTYPLLSILLHQS